MGLVALGALFAGAVYGAAFSGIPLARAADGPLGAFLQMPVEWRALYLRVSGLGEPGRTAGYLASLVDMLASLLEAYERRHS